MIEDLIKDGVRVPDLVSMHHRASEHVEDAGPFLDEMMACEAAATTWNPENVRYWCKEVRRRHLREMQRVKAGEVSDPTNQNPEESIYELNQISSELLSSESADGTWIADAVKERVDELEKIQQGKIKDRAIRIGLRAFDDGGGMRPSELWTVAAPPGGGKSVIALQVAEQVSKKGEDVLFFSLEMSRAELVRRLWSNTAKLSNENMTGKEPLTNMQWSQVARRSGDLSELRLKVFDAGSMTAEKIASVCRQHALTNKIGLVVVDYLQIVTPGPNAKNSEHERLAEVTRNMKSLSKDADCIVMLLSQLNKEGQKTDSGVQLHHLAGSSGAANDSDAVIFVSRPHMNNDNADEKEAFLDRKKYRHGRTATFKCVFDGDRYLFRDLAAQDY